jgi:uncharacterized protein (DUF927 family)
MNLDELKLEMISEDDIYLHLLSIKDAIARTKAEIKIRTFCKKNGITREFEKMLKEYQKLEIKKRMTKSAKKTLFPGQPLDIFCGDWQAECSVYKVDINFNTGEDVKKEASRIPVMPVEIYENMDTNIEKVKIVYFKEDWKSLIAEKVTISSQTKIIELSNYGIEVNTGNAKYLVEYLHDCITLNPSEVIPKYKSVGRMGWVENGFMPYDTDIKFDGEKENKYIYQSIHSKGSYTKWIEFIKPLRKSLQFRMLLSASFASVLLEKISALPFVFHLWGGTGTGKTVALMCAASVWGNPAMGKMTRTMNMTANSMLSVAAFLHDLPFIGDELQTIKTKWDNYDNLIMKITEGIDRGRMSYNQIQDTKSWKCAFLFTGEEPCTKQESGGGVINRVIEVECTDVVVADGNKTVNFINKNYGHAGSEFVSIIKNIDLTLRYEEIFKEIIETCDTTEKQALSMSIILLADEICSKHIFKDSSLSISDVKKYLASKTSVDVAERAYEYIINLVSSNINNFDSSKFVGECWGKIEECFIWFNKQILIRELNAVGFSFEAVKKKWDEKGYLLKNSQGRYHHQRKVNNFTALYMKIFFENSEHVQTEVTQEDTNDCPFK